MILRTFVFLVVSYFAFSAFAEYRAFELRIEKTANPEEYRTIISNLDPVQYRGYYFVQNDERVLYTNTWMCHGRTGNYRKICDPPPAREPATEAENPADPTSVEKTLTP